MPEEGFIGIILEFSNFYNISFWLLYSKSFLLSTNLLSLISHLCFLVTTLSSVVKCHSRQIGDSLFFFISDSVFLAWLAHGFCLFFFSCKFRHVSVFFSVGYSGCNFEFLFISQFIKLNFLAFYSIVGFLVYIYWLFFTFTSSIFITLSQIFCISSFLLIFIIFFFPMLFLLIQYPQCLFTLVFFSSSFQFSFHLFLNLSYIFSYFIQVFIFSSHLNSEFFLHQVCHSSIILLISYSLF